MKSTKIIRTDMRGGIKFWIGNAVIVEADSEKLSCCLCLLNIVEAAKKPTI